MKTLFTLLVLLLSTLGFSQVAPSWKVSHNSRLLLQAKEEDADKNVIVINRSALLKTGTLQVSYQPASEKGWERTIMLMSDTDAELRTAKGGMLQLSNTVLRSLVKGKQKVMLYTISLPKDPKQRAVVRVRRIHLCTIQIKG